MPTCVMSLLREPRAAAGSRGDECTANAEHAELQVTMTTQPTNESELQLYRVLQHANLLSYYDIFISQGGDDVQQLCEAGEDEFLEIMALVGMASKPLHVRRLQKALQEWVSAPGKFHLPMVPVPTVPAAAAAGFLPVRPLVGQSPAPVPASLAVATTTPAPTRTPPQPAASSARSTPPSADSPTPSLPRDREPEGLPSPGQSQNSGEVWPPRPAGEDSAEQQYPQSGSPLQLTPTLRQSQIRRLAEAALHIAKTLPDFEPRQQHSSKRKACKELEYVLSMDPDDPKRLEKTRQYAAIYGRFDCKRKAEKPLTLHEVSVNEAAAQICLHVPALLTRRDELFPLARQVVRNSGYQYSKGHSRSQGAQGFSPRELRMPDDLGGGKRLCVDPADSPPDPAWRARQERLEQVTEELRQLQERGEELQRLQEQEPGAAVRQQMDSVESQQRQLLSEQRDLVQENKQSYKACLEFYDEDSQYSLGSAPSPPGQCNELPRAGSAFGDNSDRVSGRITNKVIASAAGTIIAVANPALSMSQLPASSTAALLKTTRNTKSSRRRPPSPPQNGRPPAD